MRVKVNKNKNIVRFSDIERGEVFKCGEVFCMRTSKPNDTNAVCLNDGILVRIYDNEEVIKVIDAHVIITE